MNIAIPQLEIDKSTMADFPNVQLDTEACGHLLREENIDPNWISRLLINPRVDPPMPKIGSFKKFEAWHWKNGILGLYRTTSSEDRNSQGGNVATIFLNIPALRNREDGITANDVLLHELGHAYDDYHGLIPPPKYLRLKSASILGSLSMGAILPSAFEYSQTNNVPTSAAVGLAGFVSTGITVGYVDLKLATKGLTSRGKKEIFAEQFVEKHSAAYPNLINIET